MSLPQEDSDCSLRQFLLRLPKAELHLHLEGSIEPETLREIAPELNPEEIRARMTYTGFAGFLKAYVWTTQQLRSPDGYRVATRGLLRRLVRQNVQAAE